MFFADQVRSEFGKFALAKAGKAFEQFFGGDEAQDGIAHELQLFVISDSSARGTLQRLKFAGLRAMSQCLFQQFGALELVSQGCLQGRAVA